MYPYTAKALLRPPGGYLILEIPEGRFIREGGLLERGAYSKSKMERIDTIDELSYETTRAITGRANDGHGYSAALT